MQINNQSSEIPPSFTAGLVEGRRLARNAIWSFLGNGIPLLVALLSIPLLTQRLEINRLGLLMLAWATIGYFGLFDLGLGRALTKLVAERLGNGNMREIPGLFWAYLAFVSVIGVVGALALLLASKWLIYEAFKIPPALELEALQSFYLLVSAIPIVALTTGLRGFLEAHQRFASVNSVRIPMAVLIYAGPLLVLPFSETLPAIIGFLVAIRLGAAIAHLTQCFLLDPALRQPRRITRQATNSLLQFGSWMALSNVLSHLLVSSDRFLIAVLLSAEAVAYYATPQEIVARLLIIPGAIAPVLFPAFSTVYVSERSRAGELFVRGLKYTFLASFLPVLAIMVFAREGLELWLGSDFAFQSFRVLQWLALGVLLNGLAHLPSALIQGIGRPDIPAKLHLVQLPLFAIALWLAIPRYGIEGAAAVWAARVAVDGLALFFFSLRFLADTRIGLERVTLAIGGAILILAACFSPMPFVLKAFLFCLVSAGFVAVSWFSLMEPLERVWLTRGIKSLGASTSDK